MLFVTFPVSLYYKCGIGTELENCSCVDGACPGRQNGHQKAILERKTASVDSDSDENVCDLNLDKHVSVEWAMA